MVVGVEPHVLCLASPAPCLFRQNCTKLQEPQPATLSERPEASIARIAPEILTNYGKVSYKVGVFYIIEAAAIAAGRCLPDAAAAA